jgi:hypothetical protein
VRRCHGRIENVCDHGGVTREQRRQAIERMLAEDGSVTQQRIAAVLGVSQKTVSRDFEQLKRGPDLVMTNPSGRGRPRKLNAVSDPGGSISAGEQLVAQLRAELDRKDLEPDAREEGLLAQIRDVADEIAELRGRINTEGLTFKPATPGGPPRMHPAAAEVRQLRALLGRLLAAISLEESVKSPVKVKAANTRWRAHQMAKARHAEGG